MRAGGVLGGMSLERAELFWTHVAAYKLKKALKWAILGPTVQQKGGGLGGMWGGGVIGGGCRRSAGGHVSPASEASEEGF